MRCEQQPRGHWLSDRRAARRERFAVARALPGFVIVLHIAITSGQAPRQALRTVADVADRGQLRLVAEQLSGVLRAVELGADLTDAVASEDRAGRPERSSVLRVLDLLRRSEVDGSALDLHLELLLQDLRRERAHELDVAAQRLSIALLVPLVVCILPAFVVLAIVPLVLDILGQLPS